jgi:hypothetical protein
MKWVTTFIFLSKIGKIKSSMEINLSKPALCQQEVMDLKEPKESIKFDH